MYNFWREARELVLSQTKMGDRSHGEIENGRLRKMRIEHEVRISADRASQDSKKPKGADQRSRIDHEERQSLPTKEKYKEARNGSNGRITGAHPKGGKMEEKEEKR